MCDCKTAASATKASYDVQTYTKIIKLSILGKTQSVIFRFSLVQISEILYYIKTTI